MKRYEWRKILSLDIKKIFAIIRQRMYDCENADCVPPVEACDLVSYLVLKTSFITSAQFKALEAYHQFMSGWITEVNTCKENLRQVPYNGTCKFISKLLL